MNRRYDIDLSKLDQLLAKHFYREHTSVCLVAKNEFELRQLEQRIIRNSLAYQVLGHKSILSWQETKDIIKNLVAYINPANFINSQMAWMYKRIVGYDYTEDDYKIFTKNYQFGCELLETTKLNELLEKVRPYYQTFISKKILKVNKQLINNPSIPIEDIVNNMKTEFYKILDNVFIIENGFSNKDKRFVKSAFRGYFNSRIKYAEQIEANKSLETKKHIIETISDTVEYEKLSNGMKFLSVKNIGDTIESIGKIMTDYKYQFYHEMDIYYKKLTGIDKLDKDLYTQKLLTEYNEACGNNENPGNIKMKSLRIALAAKYLSTIAAWGDSLYSLLNICDNSKTYSEESKQMLLERVYLVTMDNIHLIDQHRDEFGDDIYYATHIPYDKEHYHSRGLDEVNHNHEASIKCFQLSKEPLTMKKSEQLILNKNID